MTQFMKKLRARLQVETLEDRLTPSGLNFMPIVHVEVNPQPLPPLALVAFDPLPDFSSLPVGSTVEHKHIAGAKFDNVMVGSAAAGAAPMTMSVETFYSLDVSVTETVIPPSPFAAGSFHADFSVIGDLKEILIPQMQSQAIAQIEQFAWLEQTLANEQGEISGALSMPSGATSAFDVLTWNSQLSENGTEAPLVVPHGPSTMTWNLQANIQSAGMLQMYAVPPGPPITPPMTAIFMQQDQATVCLMPLAAVGHPPQPCITINAVFNAAGTTTNTVLVPQTAFTPEVDAGSAQYRDQLNATIIMPDGSTQTLTQNAQDMGDLLAFEVKD